MFFVAVFIVAILSGATASVVGFGIGSLMTPLLAIRFGTTTAVALVTLPHAAATAVRCWRLRAHVDRRVLVRFGLLSAAGALAGALIYTRLGPGTLTRVLGGFLPLTAVAQLTAGRLAGNRMDRSWRYLASCLAALAASPAIRVVCALPR